MRIEWTCQEVHLIYDSDGIERTMTLSPGMAEVMARGLSLGAAHARGGPDVPVLPVAPREGPSPLVGIDGERIS